MTEIKAKVVLTDIEGTTTSISFVKDVLFPFAKENTKVYLETHWTEDTTQSLVHDLCNLPQFKEFTLNENKDLTLEVVSDFVNYLIDKDLKLGPLKTLQGYVWSDGYANGIIKGHIYKDVSAAMRRWQTSGLQIAIYSSGSVKAQQLLFANTEYGDLLPLIQAHFDTAIGHKQEIKSYKSIAHELNVTPADVLFLTDIAKEAEAAHGAGMQTVILNRPGNAPLSVDQLKNFEVVDNFDALILKAK